MTLAISDRIGFITLNRPRSLNAINALMMSEVTHAMSDLTARDDVHVVVLAAEGRAFSAGFDLKEAALNNYTGVGDWSRAL